MIINGIEIPDEKLIDAGWTPPLSEPLQFDGTPVWAYVSDRYDGYDDAVESNRKRQVVAAVKGRFTAVVEGKNNTESGYIRPWRYAWVIPEGEK